MVKNYNRMKRYLNFIRCVFRLWGTANWYVGIDEPTFWERVYKWRLSLKTSIRTAKIIWLNSDQNDEWSVATGDPSSNKVD